MSETLFSSQYRVRKLSDGDVSEIYELCSRNTLYYQYCPPFVSEQSILEDMNVLPPGKEMRDKYYLGFYDGRKLIAVMDLIMAYPDESTAWIGFFMTDLSIQNTGTGSRIIDELCTVLSRSGISNIRLGWVRGNPQAEHFWHKNGFHETGAVSDTGSYTIIAARRRL